MKRSLIIIHLILIGLNISAQSFKIKLGHTFSEKIMKDGFELSNGDFVFGLNNIETDSTTNFIYSILYKIDSNGNFKDSLILSSGVGSMINNNGSIYTIGTKINNNIPNQLVLNKISLSNFNITKSQNYPIDSLGFNSELKYINYCECFLGVGTLIDTLNYTEIYIFQFDSNLTKVKDKHISSIFSATTTYYPNLYNFHERTDKEGLIIYTDLLDTTVTYGTTTSFLPITLYGLDSTLSIDTSFHYKQLVSNIPISGGGSSYFAYLGAQATESTLINDSTYLFAGGAISSGHPFWGQQDIGLMLLDTSYNYKSFQSYGVRDTAEVLAFNAIDKLGNYTYVLATFNISLASSGYYLNLTKLDETGQIFWSKNYKEITYLEAAGILATSDGGALILATDIDPQRKTPSGANNLDIFILKVDSNGNQTTVGLTEDNQIPHENYLIYPNPILNELTLRKVNQFQPYRFILFDSFGRKVLEYSWIKDNDQINLSQLDAGVYLYMIIDEKGNSAGGKIVKK